MTSENLFELLAVVAVVAVVAIMLVSKIQLWIKHVILVRFKVRSEAEKRKPHKPEQPFTESEPEVITIDESEAELVALRKLIDGRKQVAIDADISYHLWGLYNSFLQQTKPDSLDRNIQGGEWYDVKILQVSIQNGLNKYEFELSGTKYKFVDDEDRQGWRVGMKIFSLFLYDDSDRCLIEIPMKMVVDSSGRNYSILSGGPNAFIPGDWINHFTNVKLKHQSIHNREIRAQKHQERLIEIEDLKNRFGFLD